MNLSRYMTMINLIVVILLVGQFLFGNLESFILAYVSMFIFFSVRTLTMQGKNRIKLYLIFTYAIALSFQITFCVQIVFLEKIPFYEQPLRRLFGIAILLLPLFVSRYVSIGKYSQFYLPSLQELSTISFAELKNGTRSIASALNSIEKASESLSADNLKAVAKDLQRHDSFSYINKDSLTSEYFSVAEKSLDDTHIYIVISRTGSPASEIISVFTQKHYNHASLSFDRELKTIISYNGGERVYPPGLNKEMLDFFNKRTDSSILVYKLPCTREQKQAILHKVAEINSEGSAYNMMGLIFKYSHKPNIMFCSQFVYRMLEIVGLTYFNKKDGGIKPTDFVEQDYYRKLVFDYEIRFDNCAK